MGMIDFIQQPWPWYVSGIIIAAVMFLLLYFGKTFGFSSNLRTICSMSGAGKYVPFFKFNWRTQQWNLIFLVGAALGGCIARLFLTSDAPLQISAATVKDLSELGFSAPASLQPAELFSWEAVFTIKGFLMMAIGGLLIGFGTRYAGGCTSGHAITGLSNLQLPSLFAVIGFFIGGLLMTHFIFPLIF
ncbi:MAG: YeeE/YedE family protein [Ferruginibacter sp.]